MPAQTASPNQPAPRLPLYPLLCRPWDWVLQLSLLAFAILSFVSSREPPAVIVRSDAEATVRSGWQASFNSRYGGATALYSQREGARLHVPLHLPQGRYRAEVVFFRLGSEEPSQLRFWVNGVEYHRRLESTRRGPETIELDFGVSQSGPLTLSVYLAQAGRGGVAFDHLLIRSLERRSGWPTPRGVVRLLALMALLQLNLVLLRWMGARIQSHTPSSGVNFAFLDGFRGLAVLLVVALHGQAYGVAPDFDIPGFGMFAELIRHGHAGVTIFFVLSSFTLYLGVRLRYLNGGELHLVTFFRNRVLRIFPGFWSMALLILVSRWWLLPNLPKLDLPLVLAQLSFAHTWYLDWTKGYLNHSVWWSVPTELSFYLLLPLLARLMRSRPWTTVISSLGVGLAFDLFRDSPGRGWPLYSVLNYLDAFTAGLLAAHLFLAAPISPAKPARWARWAGVGVALGWALLVFQDDIGRLRIYALHGHTLHHAALSFVVAGTIYAALRGGGPVSRLFSGVQWCTLGKLAYGVYLAHVPAYLLGQRLLSRVYTGLGNYDYAVLMLASLGLTLALAYLMYRWVEQPILSYGRSLAPDGRASRAVALGGLSVVAAGAALALLRKIG